MFARLALNDLDWESLQSDLGTNSEFLLNYLGKSKKRTAIGIEASGPKTSVASVPYKGSKVLMVYTISSWRG